MRIFIGVDIPQKIKETIWQKTAFLRRKYKSYNWIDKENYHITLIFLGEINPEKLPKIKTRVEKAIFETQPFPLFSYNMGLFLNKKMILYINFHRQKKLEKLTKLLAQELQDYLQKRPQRKFIPHITVGKTKRPSKYQYLLLKKITKETLIPFEFQADKITLYSSELTPHGAIYKKISDIQLKK